MTVFNGHEGSEGEDFLPRLLNSTSTLVLGIKIDEAFDPLNGACAPHTRYEDYLREWYKALGSLNKTLHHLYQGLGPTRIRKIELTITRAPGLPLGDFALAAVVSPAIAIAASVSNCTLSSGPSHHFWAGAHAVDSSILRGLLHIIPQLREETNLYNKLHARLLHGQGSLKACSVDLNEFCVGRALEGEPMCILRSITHLQDSVDTARTWLEQQEFGKFGKIVQECLSNCEKLKALQAVRKAEQS
ncbi:hypothetical protein LTR09_006291 [Extremus antarcticus]|uniref:Uncharacterized protein n=1 Tax=Extremus antarcticus TaxID=702011 RepID=A0AAJ0DFF1_9PEZI|nr:hypothetical protein LTR09_006291 [Extremus antarcticus]